MEDASDIAYHMPFLEECASRAGIIVEIGVGHGNGSTRAFARGLARSSAPVKMHIGVDPDPERPQDRPEKWFIQMVGKSEDPGTCDVVAEALNWEAPDIIFIDTIHTHEHMSLEMPIWSRLATPKTLWLYHDSHMFGVYNAMTEAIKEFATDGWEYLDHSKLAHGMGVLRHKDGPWGWIEPRVEDAPVPQV